MRAADVTQKHHRKKILRSLETICADFLSGLAGSKVPHAEPRCRSHVARRRNASLPAQLRGDSDSGLSPEIFCVDFMARADIVGIK
jgi:hypothetical protein